MQYNIFTDTMADMNWTDVKRHADEGAIVLLPLGVIEEHGPHLCTATDVYIAHMNCIYVKRKLERQGHAAPFRMAR